MSEALGRSRPSHFFQNGERALPESALRLAKRSQNITDPAPTNSSVGRRGAARVSDTWTIPRADKPNIFSLYLISLLKTAGLLFFLEATPFPLRQFLKEHLQFL